MLNPLNLSLLLILAGSILPAKARIILPAILSDHMLLQQNQVVPIWGWSTKSRETVKVWGSWSTDTVEASVHLGKWKAMLPTPPAGGPYRVEILGHQQIVIKDVLIGEVWLSSGQSNMEMGMDSTGKGMQGVPGFQSEIANARYPEIRLFKAPRRIADYPQDDLSGEWVVCSPATIKHYSAVSYYFARMLHDSLKVPIGSILSSWGGTAADAWVHAPDLEEDPVLAAAAVGIQEGSRSPRGPGLLYNGMIHPLLQYRIAGVIWYQGESNRWRPEIYRRLMGKLICSWRQNWGYPFPFYFVQIAPYDYGLRDSPNGPLIREAQLQTLQLPHTGMAVTADVGHLTNIHPRPKRPVGERLARWALAKQYGFRDIPYSGPLYKEFTIVGSEVHISFEHAEGLQVRGATLAEIYIAGADRQFHPAQVRIEAGKLIVFSPDTSAPVAVRYGFSDTDQMNLYNAAGLPASPFRTDDWAFPGN